jgi:hypothetical protein
VTAAAQALAAQATTGAEAQAPAQAPEAPANLPEWANGVAPEVGAWLLIIEGELNEAKQAWLKNSSDYDALLELVQVAATVVACLEQHGAPWSTARWRIKIE